MTRTILRTTSILGLLAGYVVTGPAGCITIHIHFPEKELRKAAEEIVEEARPEIVEADPLPTPDEEEPGKPENEPARKPGNAPESASPEDSWHRMTARVERTRFAAFALPAVSPVQDTEEEKEKEKEEKEREKLKPGKVGDVELKIDTPKIKAIIKTLRKRYSKLLGFYKGGAVGEANNGYLAERSLKGLSRKQVRDLKLLLKAENKDRLALYTEIAQENSIDKEKIPAIAKVFGPEWQKKCKTGWWIQDKKGKWVKKKPPKKKEKEKKPAAKAA